MCYEVIVYVHNGSRDGLILGSAKDVEYGASMVSGELLGAAIGRKEGASTRTSRTNAQVPGPLNGEMANKSREMGPVRYLAEMRLIT